MGTPLKHLSTFLSPKILSPRVLSPSSSRFLQVPKSRETNGLRKVITKSKPVKKLDFSNSVEKAAAVTDYGRISVTDFDKGIKTGARKNDVLINTPNKYDIIKNGIRNETVFNILGTGGFGKVFRAVRKGKTVAMKISKRSKFSTREQNALDLNHANIVRTLEIVENQKETYTIIIMEYFPYCENLQEKLDGSIKKLGERIVLKYAKDVCEGLSYCHSQGVLHLDVKPKNILVCGDVCKLCDFGNSIKMSEENVPFEHQGTIQYTAPEILLGKFPTEKSDVYSLGILLWQILERKNPYTKIDNNETIIYMVVKCHLRPDMDVPKNELAKLYQECWNSDSSERPNLATVSEILRRNLSSV